jgi:hypothetical protein
MVKARLKICDTEPYQDLIKVYCGHVNVSRCPVMGITCYIKFLLFLLLVLFA